MNQQEPDTAPVEKDAPSPAALPEGEAASHADSADAASQGSAPARRDAPHERGLYIGFMLRRETHSSRAITSIIVALLGIAGLVYLFTEGVMAVIGAEPILVSWTQMADIVRRLPSGVSFALLATIGVLIIIAGLVLIAKALSPGVLGRHSMNDTRTAYVVDDAVVASAISRRVRTLGNLGEGQVTTSVGRKKVVCWVTPTSGVPQHPGHLKEQIEAIIDDYGLSPRPHVSVKLSQKGMVAK